MFGLASAVSRAHKWSSTPSGTQIVGLLGVEDRAVQWGDSIALPRAQLHLESVPPVLARMALHGGVQPYITAVDLRV